MPRKSKLPPRHPLTISFEAIGDAIHAILNAGRRRQWHYATLIWRAVHSHRPGPSHLLLTNTAIGAAHAALLLHLGARPDAGDAALDETELAELAAGWLHEEATEAERLAPELAARREAVKLAELLANDRRIEAGVPRAKEF